MFFSLGLFLRDLVHFLHHAVSYLLFMLPGYLQWRTGHTRMHASYIPRCFEQADAKITSEILRGIYHFHGETIENPKNLWEPVSASYIWRKQMHSFVWLPHLALSENPTAHHRMRSLIADWGENNKQWSLPAWRSDVVGVRLYHLLSHYKIITHQMNDSNIRRFHALLYQHYRHLKKTAHWEMRGSPKLVAQMSLVVTMLCKSDNNKHLRKHLIRLVDELNLQILLDGGHIERNAETQFEILRFLCILYDLFVRDQRDLPAQISATIDKMVPFLRMMTAPDGHFYMFNGSGVGHRQQIEELLHFAVPDGRLPAPPKSAPHSGFELLKNQHVSALVDVGTVKNDISLYRLYAGTLSIELYMMNRPMIVSCGSFENHANPYWSDIQRGTMASSSISVGGFNSSSLRRYSNRRAKCQWQRRAQEGHILLTARHNGYNIPCATTVERNLHIEDGQAKILCEDRLISREDHDFHIRLHLAHDLEVRTQGTDVFLQDNQSVFQFICDGAEFSIEKSLYSPDHLKIYSNRQLVLSGHTSAKEVIVKWSIKYLCSIDKFTRQYGAL